MTGVLFAAYVVSRKSLTKLYFFLFDCAIIYDHETVNFFLLKTLK